MLTGCNHDEPLVSGVCGDVPAAAHGARALNQLIPEKIKKRFSDKYTLVRTGRRPALSVSVQPLTLLLLENVQK